MTDIEQPWTTVPKRRAGNPQQQREHRRGPVVNRTGSDSEVDCNHIIEQVNLCKQTLLASTYLPTVVSLISSQLKDGHEYTNLLVLGLGSLTSPVSQLQLAMYLCLCEHFLPNNHNSSKRGAFDPATTEREIVVYEHFSIPLITANTKGKHVCTGNVLFFLPHCPYRLYCNILWANWDNLDKVHIFGNRYERLYFRHAYD